MGLANKDSNSKYVYPFCTVLVDWIGTNVPQPCLINGSNYKRLFVSGKNLAKRIDLKFPRMACMQVERFARWARNERLAREVSSTPLYETPEPEKRPYGSAAGLTNSLGNADKGNNLSTKRQGTNGQGTNGLSSRDLGNDASNRSYESQPSPN
jgi:hypothetical protein